jgi:hypothetical protein
MKISMYQASVPTFIRMLENLAAILEKGAAHAEARKIDPAVLVASRLYPDMFPLVTQVQIAADAAKGGAARLAQQEPPSYPDNEATFRRIRGPDRDLEDPERHEVDAGNAVPAESRAAEPVFSRHDRVRDPAAQRGGAREGRFPRQVLKSR